MSTLRTTLVLARNYTIYREHAFRAATRREAFPLSPKSNFVISVASYPKRIHLVPAVFESLARQTLKPRHAYLVLSVEDYPNRSVPRGIRKLSELGVEIVWTENNPFAVKKLVPVWGRHPDCAVCTFDDDIIYGPKVLEGLAHHAGTTDRRVVGYWGKSLYRKGTTLGMWFRTPTPANEQTPTETVYLIAGSGVWYAPGSLHDSVTNLEAIHRIVPGRGSDIWFWAAALAGGGQHLCISSMAHSRMWIPIPQNTRTQPRDRPGSDALEQRFQMAIDFFGIREKLLAELPDHGEDGPTRA